MARRIHATDARKVRMEPARDLECVRLHPSLAETVLEQAQHDMRRVEVVKQRHGLATRVVVHNKPIR